MTDESMHLPDLDQISDEDSVLGVSKSAEYSMLLEGIL